MNILNELLGENALEIWIAGIFWAFFGIISVKLWFLNSEVKFNLKYWLNDNILDIVKGLIWALVILRLGDIVIQILKNKFGYDLPETTDFVAAMILISGFIQYRLHKKRKPISKKVADEMEKNNLIGDRPNDR